METSSSARGSKCPGSVCSRERGESWGYDGFRGGADVEKEGGWCVVEEKEEGWEVGGRVEREDGRVERVAPSQGGPGPESRGRGRWDKQGWEGNACLDLA